VRAWSKRNPGAWSQAGNPVAHFAALNAGYGASVPSPERAAELAQAAPA
jgi:hypothetical protein